MEKPTWCAYQDCEALNHFSVAEWTGEKWDKNASGVCIGKLKIPADHGRLKGINDLEWCVLSGSLSRFQVNKEDLASFMLLFAYGLKRAGQPLSKWVAEEIMKSCV